MVDRGGSAPEPGARRRRVLQIGRQLFGVGEPQFGDRVGSGTLAEHKVLHAAAAERRRLGNFGQLQAGAEVVPLERRSIEAAGAVQAFFDLDPVERTEMLALMIAGVRS